MLCDTTSSYPDKIDDMIFFQDNNLEKNDVIKEYENLIAQGKYDDANRYINQQKGLYGYFADYFNLIENKIYRTQDHLLKKPPKEQSFIYYDGDNFPLGLHILLNSFTNEELKNLTNEELGYITNIDANGNLSDYRNLCNYKNIIWI